MIVLGQLHDLVGSLEGPDHGAGTGQGEDGDIHPRRVADHVGGADRLGRLHGHQPGTPGTDSDQVHAPHWSRSTT